MSIDLKITVDELIALRFSLRTQKDKVRIISDGRPRPNIKMSALTVKVTPPITTQNRHNIYDKLVWHCRQMNNSVQSFYDKIEWLTFSTITQSFYCWPCLLFQPPGLWNETGISDVISLTEEASEHEKTPEHIEAVFQLRIFVDQNLVAKKDKPDTADKNPELFKRLTDVVCTLAVVQQPPIESDNSRSLFEVKKCTQVMQLLRKYDSLNKCDSDDAINLMKKSPEVINSTVNAVIKVMKSSIIKEISSSKYVSLILSQHSNVKVKAQISSILRYVKDGKVYERFLGFTHIFSCASIDTIYKHIMSIVHEFKLAAKCIAVSLDGAILSSSNVIALLTRLKTGIRDCIFVPWHSHNVDYVLQKSLSTHQKCQHFFKTMKCIEAYFCENSELCKAFYDFVAENRLEEISINSRSVNNWYIKPNFITYVLTHRQHFVLFFDSIIANSYKWDADDITKALGFRKCLQDLLMVFLFIVFSKMFGLTSTVNTALNSDIPERNFGKGMVFELLNNLKQMQKDFEDLWSIAVKEIGGDMQVMRGKKYYTAFFHEIMKRVIGEIELRYSVLDNFQFCSMFDFEVDGWFAESNTRFKNLIEFYTFDFSRSQTLSEMELLWKNNAFAKKSVYDLHQYLYDSNLKHTFKALFDISERILVQPFKQLSPTYKISTLNKIEKWSFGPEDEPECDNGSIVFVESDYLQEIKQSPTFYDEVFDNISL